MSIFKKLMLLTLVMSTLAVVASASAQPPYKAYLPLIRTTAQSPIFAFEASVGLLQNSLVKARIPALQATWVRLNGITWSRAQPNEGGSYDWSSQAKLEGDIAAAHSLGLIPTVIIRGTPAWAAVDPSKECSAVREDKYAAYAAFLETLAARYRGLVNYWEIGNEPDVAPWLIPGEYPYGCLGDSEDPFYAGERYGRMLQVASAALKRGNPSAKIIFGGLLLDRPETTNPVLGKPERFFEGALRAGAANAFDILAFHSYPSYSGNRYLDHDIALASANPWTVRGGMIIGKISYLREVMARYGVSKPMWLNETALLCFVRYGGCEPPPAEFFAAQADHLPRVFARAAVSGIEMVTWYTVDGPGWNSSGLLDSQQKPRPVYNAWTHMYTMVKGYRRVESVDYGAGIEAYRFVKDQSVVDVLWSRGNGNIIQTATLPLAKFRAANGVTGGSVPGIFTNGNAQITVGFSPVYIDRLP